MQLLDIKEPGKHIDQSLEDLTVGIDFGTTHSLIAISREYKSEIIVMPDGVAIVPSTISITDEKVIIGERFNPSSNSKIIRSIKRFMGKSSDELRNSSALIGLEDIVDLGQKLPHIIIGQESYSVPEIAAKIFTYLKIGAEVATNKKIKKAVVSVPAYFDDAARGQVMLAAKIAGLEVIRLIAEPTAAAYAYGLNRQKTGRYLVYDLGGGTFDISVLNMQQGVLQVIATGGDNNLGGDDIDVALAKYLCQIWGVELHKKLIASSKEAKEALSYSDHYDISYLEHKTTLTKTDFEQIITPIIQRTIHLVKSVLYDIEHDHIDGIILVGGSTRTKLVRQLLEQNFNTTIYTDLDPDKVVAMGAALQGENLSNGSSSLLLDVLPLSVGVEMYGGVVEKMIMRNTPLPFVTTRYFTTQVDNQTGINFHIVQGEREFAKDCRSLARFELKNLPPQKAGKVRVAVTFAVDADGILSVNAIDEGNNKEVSISVNPTYNLSTEEIDKFLRDAYQNVHEDHEQRKLAQLKAKAESLIAGIGSAIKEAPELLNEQELEEIELVSSELQKLMQSANYDDIMRVMDHLNELASGFIHKYLDKGANLHLHGRLIDDLKL